MRAACLLLVACHGLRRPPAAELRRQHARALAMAMQDDDGSTEVLVVIDARRLRDVRPTVAVPGPVQSRR